MWTVSVSVLMWPMGIEESKSPHARSSEGPRIWILRAGMKRSGAFLEVINI